MELVGIVGKILSCYLITLLTCYAIAFPCNVKVLVVFTQSPQNRVKFIPHFNNFAANAAFHVI
jgi:hypothetical protein